MATLLEAMARMEGWKVEGSRCRRNHNPGNIIASRFTDAYHAIGADGRFAVFASDEDGFLAMRALLSGPAYARLTVAQAIEKWAPPSENNTDRYLELVCEWSGCKPDDELAAHLSDLQQV